MKFQFALMRVSSSRQRFRKGLFYQTLVSIRADASELLEVHQVINLVNKPNVSIRADASELLEGVYLYTPVKP